MVVSEPAVKLPRDADMKAPPGIVGRSRNLVLDWVCRWVFSFVRMAPSAVEHLRSLAAEGSVVYVMRQRSWVDYLLVTCVLMRERLPTPEFANGISPLWFRPWREVFATAWHRLRGVPFVARPLREFEDRDRCQRLVTAGRPVLIFMRGRVPGMRLLAGRRRALTGMRTGSEYLREVVHQLWDSPQRVALVPIAVLRGRGMRRKESRLATLVYSVQEFPTELRRLVSLLWNARDTSISVGVEVHLHDFMRQYQREGEERIVRRLARALQIFLYREERVVWGPPLLTKRQVRQRVLRDDELAALIRKLGVERKQSESQLWRQAARYFDEMAANFHSFYFSTLEFVFNRIWPRLFQGVEYSGLDKVAECVKDHPIVLVPCHRSHFDYLILSYLFHLNYLSPPHIAAGINLSFWPLGSLFRGAGAYFIRRSFEGNELYKMVFRKYLTFLIREGYTQEFFIEGGRSRTGKILTPKLGMLSAIVEAFVQGVRRDLYLVPVSIHYGRVVEEESYQRELGGHEKEPESLRGLLRARSVFRRRHGTVDITFGDPMSLNEALGARKERFRHGGDHVIEEEKRRFVQRLGFRLLREVNNVAVAGATSVSATVLLSLPHSACRQHDFVTRALALTQFLRHRNVRFTASLERNAQGGFRENLAFLENGGLVRRLPGEEHVIHLPNEKRLALDFHKNNTIHFFLLPALLTDALTRGLRGGALKDDIMWWLELFRWEFALPERETIAAELGGLLAYFEAQGVLAIGDGQAIRAEHPLVQSTLGILDNFRESYWVAAQVLLTLSEEGLTRRAVLDRMRKRYQAGLLLGEVRKPEGNSSVTLGNALSRYAEIECVCLRAGKGREPLIQRGPNVGELSAISARIEPRVRRL